MNVPRALTTEEEWMEVRDFLRPVMVSFIECKNVYLQGSFLKTRLHGTSIR
jgi:polygalacturonase